MNLERIEKELDTIKECLTNIQASLYTETEKEEEKKEEQNHVDSSLLAKRVANSYKTFHPEYKVESQYANLKTMINGEKISIVIAWIRSSNIEGLQSFFRLPEDEKRVELLKAIEMFKAEILDIFNQRFHFK